MTFSHSFERTVSEISPKYSDGEDKESEEVGSATVGTCRTSTSVRGSQPSVHSAPPGAKYTSYHSERHREPPITSVNVPSEPV
jgi:hypothetical protein